MKKNRLSIFVDESGDFGDYGLHSPYYLVTMVMHDQAESIQGEVSALKEQVAILGFDKHAIHAGPLIRREGDYKQATRIERKKLFNMLCHFIRNVKINYITVCIEKFVDADRKKRQSQLTRALSQALREKDDFIKQYDEIIVYYDNGQNDLTHILGFVFNSLYGNVEFRKVVPKDYVLFQTADLICTLELTARKFAENRPSKSELDFFATYGSFRKNFLKAIRRKML